MSSLAYSPLFRFAASIVTWISSKTLWGFLSLLASCSWFQLWVMIIRGTNFVIILPSTGSGKLSTSYPNWAEIPVNLSTAQLVKTVGSAMLLCSSSHRFASATQAKYFPGNYMKKLISPYHSKSKHSLLPVKSIWRLGHQSSLCFFHSVTARFDNYNGAPM